MLKKNVTFKDLVSVAKRLAAIKEKLLQIEVFRRVEYREIKKEVKKIEKDLLNIVKQLEKEGKKCSKKL